MSNKDISKHEKDCECDKPEVRDSFKDCACSEEQIIQCHGREFLDKMKKEGKL